MTSRRASPGTLRRLTPVSNRWGFDRGTPVDRDDIEDFLSRHAPDRRRLGGRKAFCPGNSSVTTYGNVLSAVAFLHGVAAEELKRDELDHLDRRKELLVAVRAVRQP